MSHVCHSLADILWRRRDAEVVVTEKGQGFTGFEVSRLSKDV